MIKYNFVLARENLVDIYVKDVKGYVWHGNGLQFGRMELGITVRRK